MANILLIGGAGFIGSHLIQEFVVSQNHNIFVYGPHLASLDRLERFKHRITIIQGTLSDYDFLFSVINDHKIDVLVHLVSTLIPASTYDNYQKELENVIFPSVRVMSYCAAKKIKFVFFSSGGTIYGNKPQGFFSEIDTPAPISYYGLSKQILEDCILFENRRNNLTYLILRPSNPFGIWQTRDRGQGLIAVSIGRILANEPITIWGNGSTIRDYIYIDDLAKVVVQLIDKNIINTTVNIGSGKGNSINDVVRCLKYICSDKEINVIYEKKRSIDVDTMVLNTKRLRSLVDYKLTSLEDGLRIVYNYEKAILKV